MKPQFQTKNIELLANILILNSFIMRKFFIISFLALLGITQAAAYNNEYVPLVREGVKWVNKKVIIDHGDTTSYYYVYEILGDDPDWQFDQETTSKLCHYYTGNHIDFSNDSIISSFAEVGSIGAIVNCHNNWALDKADLENRTMMPRFSWMSMIRCEILYQWLGLPDAEKDPYLFFQLEPIFTEENLVEADPIEIDGHQCGRLAYVKEPGDTMCYLVESIGFDSRNMGDLLTPFLKEPDPDADYQEYWGLSHVIKDGQIIYKGMCYNPDNMTAVDEVAADKARQVDGNYYNLMGQPMGKQLPTSPGIYIHHGKKIIVK